ncbi:MAG: DNA-3-methyladenine glycosylase family protein [Candidatus Ranarchaeia archaeon]
MPKQQSSYNDSIDLDVSRSFRLDAKSPFHFGLTISKPAGWDLFTPFEVFENNRLWTAFRWQNRLYGLELENQGTVRFPRIRGTCYSDHDWTPQTWAQLVQLINWALNLQENIQTLNQVLSKDPWLRGTAQRLYGMRLSWHVELFPELILAVVLQMAPIARSIKMRDAVITNYGSRIRFAGHEILYWPSPQQIAQIPISELEKTCKLGYRAKVIRGLAETLSRRFPTLRVLAALPPEQAKARLRELNGIGEYSADIVLLHYGFPVDVWSARIFSQLMLGTIPESPRSIIPKLRRMAEKKWGKWKGYVFAYVLNDIDQIVEELGLQV